MTESMSTRYLALEGKYRERTQTKTSKKGTEKYPDY